MPDRTDRDPVPQLSPTIHRRLLAFAAGWPGERHAANTLLTGLNTSGTRPPLFFCLQGYRELSQLARHLGPDQPVYGMRSGHGAMEYTDENVAALAEHYVHEIDRVLPAGGRCLLGGNCQGALIAFAIARRLHRLDHPISLLCLLDSYGPQPWHGKIALFFSQWSLNNPYRYYRWPQIGWQKLTTQGVSVDFVPGTYGESFDEPNVGPFAAALQHAVDMATSSDWGRVDPLSGAAPHRPHAFFASFAGTDPSTHELPRSAYRARFATRLPCPGPLLARGTELTLAVEVTNASDTTWPPTCVSGITLANRWCTPDGTVTCWLDGRASLDTALPAGGMRTLRLQIQIPDAAGEYQLEIDMVEEGITWFVDRGSQTLRMAVRVGDTRRAGLEQRCSSAAHVRAARDAAERGDVESALLHARAAADQEPTPAPATLLLLGEVCLRAGRAQEAVEALTRAKADGATGDVDVRLGAAWLALGDASRAIAVLEPYVSSRREVALPALRDLGAALERTGGHARAQSVFARALELAPHEPRLWSARARCLFALGKMTDALACCNEGLRLEPDNPHLLFLRADAARARGDRASAVRDYQSALDAGLDNAWPWLRLGELWREERRFDAATRAFVTACECEPNNADAFFHLAALQQQSGDLDAAVANYRRATQIDPQHYWAHKNQGDTLLQQGDVEGASAAYHQAAAVDGARADAWLGLSRCMRQLGQKDLARTYARRARVARPRWFTRLRPSARRS